MKEKHEPSAATKPDLANPTVLPNAEWPSDKQTWETVSIVLAAKPPQKEKPMESAETPVNYLKTLISIATNAWRAKMKMLNPVTGEVREDMKRVDRHIEAIHRNLADIGIAIRDHTGEAYDEGQPMKVVASKPTLGLNKKLVSETLLPSIFWNNRLIQNGEIEIAIPANARPSTESQTLT